MGLRAGPPGRGQLVGGRGQAVCGPGLPGLAGDDPPPARRLCGQLFPAGPEAALPQAYGLVHRSQLRPPAAAQLPVPGAAGGDAGGRQPAVPAPGHLGLPYGRLPVLRRVPGAVRVPRHRHPLHRPLPRHPAAAPGGAPQDGRGRADLAQEPAQPALPVQHAQQHLLPDPDRPGPGPGEHRAAQRHAPLCSVRDRGRQGPAGGRGGVYGQLHPADAAPLQRAHGSDDGLGAPRIQGRQDRPAAVHLPDRERFQARGQRPHALLRAHQPAP